jgi:glycosyltransferase involved in cell wall biosynthesis
MNQQSAHLKYTLITPARNEEAFIEGAIRSVISQTVKPEKWVIVSDGSTDRTDEIVKKYASEHTWIELLRMPERRDRSFAAKATCFNAGYEKLKTCQADIIGNLDADITLNSDYYEFLLQKFAEMPKLGVAGTPFVEDENQPQSHSYAHKFADLEHVSGACQMFRRSCFDDVGGYTPIKGGGIDWVAVTSARMKGWQTRTFVERVCFHHRKMGTASRGALMARFQHGQEDYYVGGHPLWQILRGIFQMKGKPYILGGLFLISGYFWAMVKRVERPVSPELISFHRQEQMSRIRRMIFGRKHISVD